MNKNIQDTLNLPDIDELINEQKEMSAEVQDANIEEIVPVEDTAELLNALTTTEKIDSALPAIRGLAEHEKEMDDIAGNAMKSFNNLAELAENSPENYTSRMYEVASNMLRTAMDAKNSKIDRKLKMVEMQLRKARLDFETQRDVGGGATPEGAEFDRNELLRHITDNNKNK